jgi:hypothetical protein
MGGESEAAWRTLLNDLANRGLKTPRKLATELSESRDRRVKRHRSVALGQTGHSDDQYSTQYPANDAEGREQEKQSAKFMLTCVL